MSGKKSRLGWALAVALAVGVVLVADFKEWIDWPDLIEGQSRRVDIYEVVGREPWCLTSAPNSTLVECHYLTVEQCHAINSKLIDAANSLARGQCFQLDPRLSRGGADTASRITLVVGLLALLGVIIAQLNARAVMRAQLANARANLAEQLTSDRAAQALEMENDALRRKEEREMQLRRDVYLEAESAMAHVAQLIPRAGNLQFEAFKLQSEFSNDLAVIAKIHIVGSDTTIAAVMRYVEKVGVVFMEMLTMRLDFVLLDSAIASEVDPQRKVALALQKQELFIAVGESGINHAVEVASLLPDVVHAVRSELGIPLARFEYDALWQSQFTSMREAWRRSKAEFEKFAKKLRS